MSRFLLLAGVAMVASACAATRLPAGAPEAEVRAVLGPPALELANADGSRQLAYPTGPLGTQTHMAHIGPDGRLQRLEQVLDDGRFHQIRAGMTRDELLRLIGPPSETMRFDNLGQTAWDYRFVDTWGYEAILSVMIDDGGIVRSRITRRLERERRLFGF